MDRPTINDTQAVFQAGETVSTYLAQAIAFIDKHLGKGYAVAHPALLAECIRSQTMDFNGCAMVGAIYGIQDSINEVASSIWDLTQQQAEPSKR